MTDDPDIAHLDFTSLCDLEKCVGEAEWVVRVGKCPACGAEGDEYILCTEHMQRAVKYLTARHTCGAGIVPVTTWRQL